MPKKSEDFIRELEGFLRANKFQIQPINVKGQITQDDDATGFQFHYKNDRVDYGTVTLLSDTNGLTVIFDQEKTKDPIDSGWTNFLKKLKNWAFTNGQPGGWEIMNIDRLNSELNRRQKQQREEKLLEGWWGNKTTSYNDRVPTIKLVVKHTQAIGEGDRRYNHIDKIFLENELGERILVPSKKPSIGRAFARHLAEGGQYNDQRWNHIKELAEDISKLSGFLRAAKTDQFNEGAVAVVNQVVDHYKRLRESITKMQGSRGYNQYFEGWQPTLVEGGSECDYSGMFVTNKIDPRIERALPVLEKLNIKVNEISEANEFESWANSIVEDLSTVMNKKVQDFIELLSDTKPEPVGNGAINWKGKLDDIIVNQNDKDDLFAQLEDIAETDPDNDGKPVIVAWLQKHKNDEFYGKVLDGIESTTINQPTEIPGINVVQPRPNATAPVAPNQPSDTQPLAEKTRENSKDKKVAVNEAVDESWVAAYNALVANDNEPTPNKPRMFIQQLAMMAKDLGINPSLASLELNKFLELYVKDFKQRRSVEDLVRKAIQSSPSITDIKKYSQQSKEQETEFSQRQELTALQHDLSVQQLIRQNKLDEKDSEAMLQMDIAARQAIREKKQELELDAKERLAKIEQEIRASREPEEKRKHELAMAQETHQYELDVIRVTAEGEYKKAKLEADYQIKLKELENIDNISERQFALDKINAEKQKQLDLINAETSAKIKTLSAETRAETRRVDLKIREQFMDEFKPVWSSLLTKAGEAGRTVGQNLRNVLNVLNNLASVAVPTGKNKKEDGIKESFMSDKDLNKILKLSGLK